MQTTRIHYILLCCILLVPIDADFYIDTFWLTGAPEQPIFPADVHCSGSELTIADCPLSGIDIHDDCYPKSDIGIACPIYGKLSSLDLHNYYA